MFERFLDVGLCRHSINAPRVWRIASQKAKAKDEDIYSAVLYQKGCSTGYFCVVSNVGRYRLDRQASMGVQSSRRSSRRLQEFRDNVVFEIELEPL
jgi:hypothetical protein